MTAKLTSGDDSVLPKEPTRAAQYVRKSTDYQKYSTTNQSEINHLYARQHGMEIIRTYADEGISGLNFERRHALQQLIADIQSHKADFSIILVYHVSRWGRFQDIDESAYYEFICRRAGIDVRYCAEQFENDGSLISTIAKNIKRVMAGEFSRELSIKVFAGQMRIGKLGFRLGSRPGYGLRRYSSTKVVWQNACWHRASGKVFRPTMSYLCPAHRTRWRSCGLSIHCS